MKKKARVPQLFVWGIFALLLSSCSGGVFDTHPYDVDISGETGINARQMSVLVGKLTLNDVHLLGIDTRLAVNLHVVGMDVEHTITRRNKDRPCGIFVCLSLTVADASRCHHVRWWRQS